MIRQTRFIVVLLLVFGIVIGLPNVFAQEDDNTLVDVIARATGGSPAQFTAISAALQASDPAISGALADPSQYFTIFAPADAAFAGLPTAALGGLLGDQALLSGILSYHVVSGFYPAEKIEEAIANDGGLTLTTLTGEEIVISRNERGTFVNDAFLRIEGGMNYLADNGVIHIIESVLFPPSAQDQLNAILGTGGTSEATEEGAVEEEAIPSTAEQVSSAIGRLLGASTSDAQATEEEAVEEEAIPSTAEQVSSAIGRLLGASTSDAQATEEEAVEEEAIPSTAEQVSSAIGRLLGTSTSGDSDTSSSSDASSSSIADLLTEAGNFEMLNMILTNAATDYHAQLSGEGEYTLFAPTDDAFNALASGLGIDLRAALAFPDILIDIVGYHVAEGIITGDTLAEGAEFATIQGESVAVSVVDGFILLNGSVSISISDIEASNGVLHVIDGVLIPQSTVATFGALGLSLP